MHKEDWESDGGSSKKTGCGMVMGFVTSSLQMSHGFVLHFSWPLDIKTW